MKCGIRRACRALAAIARRLILHLSGGAAKRRDGERELTGAQQWNATFDAIPELVSVQDMNYRLIRVNRAYAEALGLAPDQLIGRPCHEAIHHQEVPWPQCPAVTAFETKRFVQVEFFEPHLGAYLEVSVSPLLDLDGAVVGCVHVARNVTERKRAEQQQAELLKQLTEVNRELNDFAHVVSHDLKAPLRGIKTLADWLVTDCKDNLSPQGTENLHLLSRRVDRMQSLIDGILQYSRVGRTEQDVVPIDLARVVPEVIDNLNVPAHVSIRIENRLPVVCGDSTRITQVFQNLLSNAIKYLDKPQGHITVACREAEGFWKFSVADNGPGIDAKHFERIFQLFQTLSSRDSRESTGVGLTITKKIVEMYGGRIWVESTVGQGSTFHFTLPQAKQEELI